LIETPPASRPKPELAAQLESDIVKDDTRITGINAPGINAPGINAPDHAAPPPSTETKNLRSPISNVLVSTSLDAVNEESR